jgi:hypothetical protein
LDFRNEYDYFYSQISPFTGNRKISAIPSPNPLTGRLPNKYALGNALLLLPFFAVGHILALALNLFGLGINPDGYSPIYQLFAGLGSISYGLLALFVIFRLGRKLFSPEAAPWGIVALWGATPLVYYMTMEPLMSHAFSAFAVAIFLTYWLSTLKDHRPVRWFVLGLLGGLVCIVRFQDAPFLALPLFHVLVSSFTKRKFDASSALRSLRNAAIFALAAGMVISPQLAANRYLYGSFWTTGYAQESFSNWHAPRLLYTLFSAHSGLLLWSPILIFALMGLWIHARRQPRTGWLLWLGFLLQWYLVSSWYAPHQGDSFGNRMLLNCTVIFGLGLMALLERLKERPPRFKAACFLILGCVAINGVLAGLYCFRIIGYPY